MAAILGLSPWKTPLDVYLEKRGEAPPADADPEKAKLFRRGKRLEPVICQMLEEERGLQIIARNKRYSDAQYPFMSCEVDAEAMVGGEHINVECKTAHHFTEWKYGEEGTDQLPIEYCAQAAFAMMITGRQKCLFGVLFGADNLVTFELVRDPETEAAMRQRAVAFWEKHVLAGIPPDPLNLPDVLSLFARAEKPITVEATEEVFKLVCEFDEVKQAARAASERADDLKFEIGKAMLGEAAIIRPIGARGGKYPPEPTAAAPEQRHLLVYGGTPVLTVALQSQNRIDSDAVRKKHPEVAAECSKETKFFVFREPTKKEKLLAR